MTPDFQEYMRRTDEIDFLGKAVKVSTFKYTENLNHTFASFMKDHPREMDCHFYRQVQPSMGLGLKSFSKYDKEQPLNIDMECFALAGNWVKKHFGPYMMGSQMLEFADVKPLADRTTSAGFPWTRIYHRKGDFLDSGVDQMLDDFWKDLCSDERKMRPIFTCSEKRELRPIEKLAQGKVRTFTAAPTEHSLALNRFCFDMNYRFYDSHMKTWSFVGGSKYLQGWDRLYHKLARFEYNAFELDVSDWDSSCNQLFLEGQRDIRWSFLSSKYQTLDNWKRLCSLYDDIIHSVVVLENADLVRKHTGNPSGCANTIVDNTMILFRLFAYCYIKLARQQGIKPEYNEFMQNVVAALCGDDNTFTVSDEIKGWFNARSIIEVSKEIGFTVKVPSDDAWDARPLHECQFLSQSFVKHGERWLPMPDTDRILSSMMWGSGDGDIRWHFLRACALRNESWANIECRRILQDYIEYLLRNHGDQLIGEINGLKMDHVHALYRDNEELYSLYHGIEAAGAG